MQTRRLFTFAVILLSTTCTLSSARAQEPLRPDIEIDRSVLQDLKGYEPPPMFGAARSKPIATPPALTRVPVAPPPAQTLTMPKADALLEFPVKNTDVLTRQNATAAEETVAHARPDYSDSHTVLDLTPKTAVKAKTEKAVSKKVAKAPLPPKKPAVQLASAKSDDTLAVPKKSPAKPSLPENGSKYIPKGKPSMPAVATPAPVERNTLDAFALPLGDEIATDIPKSRPTPGERIIDQALTSRMAPVDKKDIETTLEGGKVAAGKKDEPLAMAALPSGTKSSGARIEQVSMEFKTQLTALGPDQKNTLASEILPFLQKNGDARLQIQAFAGGTSPGNDARRISLSRALSVRDYLMDKGIEASRMDVRAMGNNTKETPQDRVDLVLIRQN